MVSLLYVKKSNNAATWSDVLQEQYEYLHSREEVEVDLFEINTSSTGAYLMSVPKLLKIAPRYDIIYVNHAICGFPCIFPSLVRTRPKWVLALHESEPVLGLRYGIRKLKKLGLKKFIRYMPLMRIPNLFFDKVVVLNGQQQFGSKKKYVQCNYLGVNLKRFFPTANTPPSRTICFYPHDSSRPEKGFHKIKSFFEIRKDISLLIGGAIDNNKMPELYNKSDVAIYSGDYETYSISLLEAMACNKYIFSNGNLGLLQNLLKIYTADELAGYGIFLFSNFNDLGRLFDMISEKKKQNEIANTLDLIIEVGLSDEACNQRLLALLLSFHEN